MNMQSSQTSAVFKGSTHHMFSQPSARMITNVKSKRGTHQYILQRDL